MRKIFRHWLAYALNERREVWYGYHVKQRRHQYLCPRCFKEPDMDDDTDLIRWENVHTQYDGRLTWDEIHCCKKCGFEFGYGNASW